MYSGDNYGTERSTTVSGMLGVAIAYAMPNATSV